MTETSHRPETRSIADSRRARARAAARVCARALANILLAAAFGAFGDAAHAASFYFSNCATGGAGTLANPYCLDPGNSGLKDSFKYVMDGAAPDVGPGDTIYLCAGACDGSGTATYNLGVYGTTTSNGYTYVFSPVVSGTQASPITIRTYPGETVILSGDTNGNGIPDATEPDVLLTNTTSAGPNKAWYVWRDVIFERAKVIAFYLNSNPANWTFDNVEARYIGSAIWAGQDLYAAGCDNQQNNYVFKVAELAAPLTIRNSRFHHVCGFAHRNTVNDATGASMLIEKNEYYNLAVVSNEFIGRNITYRGNYVHDVFDGFGVEENMKNVVVEDNTLACLGQYRVSADGRCGLAIKVSDGDNGTGGTSKGITLRRNKIYSLVDGVYGGTNIGYWLAMIRFTATNSTEPINSVIENNMIWHVWTWSGPAPQGAAIFVQSNRGEITIQNNTIYDTTLGIALDANAPGVAYTVRNNLVVKANKNGQNNVELWVGANAANSIIRYNNLHHGGQGDPVMKLSGVNYTCAQMAGYQTGNRCGPTTFAKVTGAVPDWDLHLAATDLSNRDIVPGAVGAADDIDKGVRTGAIDLGADEFGVGGQLTATLAIERSPGQAAPTTNGNYVLKAGTYTVRLTTSAAVVVTPTPLTFTDVGGRQVVVPLSGTIPGTQLSGSLTIDTNVAEGSGTFTLPTGALNDGQGLIGNVITSGGTAVVDRTRPGSPAGVQTQQ